MQICETSGITLSEAQEAIVVSIRELLLLPLFSFFKSYILRREFVNGVDGIVISHMYAFQRFIRLAKARELNRLKHKHD